MKKKKITGSDVGIALSIVGIIASILVIIIDAINKESVGVGQNYYYFVFYRYQQTLEIKEMKSNMYYNLQSREIYSFML